MVWGTPGGDGEPVQVVSKTYDRQKNIEHLLSIIASEILKYVQESTWNQPPSFPTPPLSMHSRTTPRSIQRYLAVTIYIYSTGKNGIGMNDNMKEESFQGR